jgi:hypothetical protein
MQSEGIPCKADVEGHSIVVIPESETTENPTYFTRDKKRL